MTASKDMRPIAVITEISYQYKLLVTIGPADQGHAAAIHDDAGNELDRRSLGPNYTLVDFANEFPALAARLCSNEA